MATDSRLVDRLVRDREKQVKRILTALESAKNPRVPSVGQEAIPERVLVVRRKSSKALEFESIEKVPEAAISRRYQFVIRVWFDAHRGSNCRRVETTRLQAIRSQDP